MQKRRLYFSPLLLLLLFFFPHFLKAQGITDSLEKQLHLSVSDSAKLELLTSLSWEYLQVDKTKAWNYAQEELKLATKNENQKFIASAYNDLGLVLEMSGKDRQALYYHYKALGIRNKLGDKKDIGSSLSKIGNCYTELTEYTPALNAQLKALDCFVACGNKPYQAFILNNICTLYEKMGLYDQLEAYAQRSLQLQTEFRDTTAMAGALTHMANVYDHRNNMPLAIETKKQVAALFSAIGDSISLASTYIDLGVFSHKVNDLPAALNYYTMARDLSARQNDVLGLTFSEHNIGSVLIETGDYKEAEKHLDIAEKLAAADTLNDLLMQVYRDKGSLFALTNRGKEANVYYDKYATLKDSVFSNDLTSHFSEMQVKYETDKKEKANRILQQESRLQAVQLSKSRITQFFLGGMILLVMLISYLFYARYKLRQQRLLDTELIRQQQLRSKAVIDAEERERERIARELHDGVGQQLSAARLNIHGIGPAFAGMEPSKLRMLQNAGELLDESIQEVRTVSHNLMSTALLKNGFVSACRDFIEKINGSGKLYIAFEAVHVPEKMDHTLEIVLFRVMQELVSNIIRHSEATAVDIQLSADEKELLLLVQDNGKGFELSRLTEGIGLKNIKTRVTYLNGQVHFDSSPGNGTTVSVEIPLILNSNKINPEN